MVPTEQRPQLPEPLVHTAPPGQITPPCQPCQMDLQVPWERGVVRASYDRWRIRAHLLPGDGTGTKWWTDQSLAIAYAKDRYRETYLFPATVVDFVHLDLEVIASNVPAKNGVPNRHGQGTDGTFIVPKDIGERIVVAMVDVKP